MLYLFLEKIFECHWWWLWWWWWSRFLSVNHLARYAGKQFNDNDHMIFWRKKIILFEKYFFINIFVLKFSYFCFVSNHSIWWWWLKWMRWHVREWSSNWNYFNCFLFRFIRSLVHNNYYFFFNSINKTNVWIYYTLFTKFWHTKHCYFFRRYK